MLHGSVEESNEITSGEECIKECAHNCTKKDITLTEVIDCISQCKCDNQANQSTVQLMKGEFSLYSY